MSDHKYFTRSKNPELGLDFQGLEFDSDDDSDDMDQHGNLEGLIDYDCKEEYSETMLNEELDKLRGIKVNKKNDKNDKASEELKNKTSELFLSYIMMNVLSEMDMKTPRRRKRKSYLFTKSSKKSNSPMKIGKSKKGNIERIEEEIKDKKNNCDVTIEEVDLESECSSEGDSDDEGSDEDSDEEEIQMTPTSGDESKSENMSEEETTDEEYDKYDDEFCELTTNDLDEDKEYEYFSNLPEIYKKNTITELKKIKEINETEIPLRFKILHSEMDLRTKSIAMNNIEKLDEMDVSTGEYCKMDKWINGLIKIPFSKNIELPVNDNHSIKEKRDYIINAKETLDDAIYGHKEAKEHILQVIGKWIKNPKSQGNVLAIQGPMGNGKTTLVKEGISKAIGRPFSFIALGGASDASFFDGHSYTYEGSHWGRIVDILIESKCMNPVIYFDELDKVSETYKGEEIIHLLTHLTDPSQNNVFQDNYFPGVTLDLSKALFIFSFNDESKVNRILKDRMYVVNTKGFKVDDKLSITKDYLLPELLETFLFTKEEIIFPDDTIKMIIEKYTLNEEGVRNLKRSLETIISKINIYNLSYDRDANDNKDNKDNKGKSLELEFELKDFSLPFTITEEIAEKLLSLKNDSDKPPEHMYM